MGSSGSVAQTTYEVLQENTCKFKCANCLNYLSRGPIKIRLENGSILCGRCSTVNCVQSEQLANIFKNLQFLCSHEHNGCDEKIKFDDEDHENQCRYKVFHECPSGDIHCQWTGHGSEIYDHFTIQHDQLILRRPTFFFNVTESHVKTFLYKSEKYAVLLRYRFKKNANQLCFGVLSFQFDSATPKQYKVEFSHGDIKVQLETLYKCTPLQPHVPYFPEHNMAPYLSSFSHPRRVKINVTIE